MILDGRLSEIKTLLVDLDGTLVGANDLSLAVDFAFKAVKTVKQQGGYGTRQALKALSAVSRALQGKPRPEQEGQNNAQKAIQAFSTALGTGLEQAESLLIEGSRKIFPTLSRHFFPMPGAKEFIEWAKDRYPLILATNPVWPRDIVEMRVRWAGLDPALFKRITLAREMSAAKPWLTYYREILSQENLKPEECLLIGNDMKKDLAATKVGIRVFIVDSESKVLKSLNVENGISAWRGKFEDLKGLLNHSA